MWRTVFVLVVLMLFGCNENSSVEPADLHYLNGYWEISEVAFPDGTLKQYPVNTNIDFIYFEDNQGYRKKMQPRFDGSYETSNDLEDFTISNVNDIITLHYTGELSEWEEKLTQLDSLSFSVVNEDGITYSYTRFEPIKIPK
ncbi:hypothetical protein [Flagellimonas crocea]|uniref:hypothetical protein n=1 Tax=Flagellimonas crocea TaxID=3067311 RepID=UPI00296F472D|nr:hypothetical protein [Muricauda sp. DH64]